MPQKTLFIDTETFDPLLKRYGQGWCFKFHYPEVEFEVVMVGVIDQDNNEYEFFTNNEATLTELLALLNSASILVFHNALYDMGALRYLYRDKLDFKKFIILDTMLFAKADDQSRLSYGLGSLTKDLGLVEKQGEALEDYAWFSGIYQTWVGDCSEKRTGKRRNCWTRPSAKIMKDFCMSDIRRFPREIISKYCLADIRATKSLYEYLAPRLSYLDTTDLSDILKVCLDAKTWGIRVDLRVVDKLSNMWKQMAANLRKTIYVELQADADFNLDSGVQLGKLLAEKGYDVPITAKGNYSITSEWIEESGDPLIANIGRYRKALKAEKDYVTKLKLYQEAIPEKYRNKHIGWLYPTLKPLGATATGRFTSGGGTGSLELNVLAISVRNEEFGAPIREVFLPHEGEKLICRDFSNQEPRLQVHYANLLQCGGTKEIIDEWNKNPAMKYHQKVADLTKLPYALAKTVTLGLAYDMHAAGLSKKLNITYDEAKELMAQYHRLLPFMQQLQSICSKNILKIGYIKTIGGRKLYLDKPYFWEGKMRTQERKAMSKLIQGSGVDQTMKAMIKAWKLGLKVLLSVHDEIIATSAEPEKDFIILGECMETAVKLVVPVVSEGGIGNTWGEAK